MGSKTKLIDFILPAINDIYSGGGICDLFSGSCSLSGAIRDQETVYSNDIQEYSSVIADAYLNFWSNGGIPTSDTIINKAQALVSINSKSIPSGLSYENISTLHQFNNIESLSRKLLDIEFKNPFHLFTKYYSGTWWSAEQCLWIDAIREVAEEYRLHTCYSHILCSLMYAMAYCGQGTGHYAQYRDANTISSMNDIMTYRKRCIKSYFSTKYNSSLDSVPNKPPLHNHQITSLDYVNRLDTLNPCTIYADPPYCFVHYSRFYHAIETLVLYDYPEIQQKGGEVVKGRYRVGRHQSPFCIHSKVEKAFEDLFLGVAKSGSNLVLSYSDTGMITLSKLRKIMSSCMAHYDLSERKMSYDHMTMGRQGDRTRSVKEMLLIAKKR
jgi:adenine-specific DNA-methyltransferase